MKKLFSIFWKVCVIFTSVFIMPAVIASIITFDLETYMLCVTAPLYCAVMFFIALIFTGYAVDDLEKIS
jgi:hypothetical protein